MTHISSVCGPVLIILTLMERLNIKRKETLDKNVKYCKSKGNTAAVCFR